MTPAMDVRRRTVAEDLAELIKRFEEKEKADAKHMAEMHAKYDKRISDIEYNLQNLFEDRHAEAQQMAQTWFELRSRLDKLEDAVDPRLGEDYRNLSEGFSRFSLDATPKRSSIVDEVFKARK